jgi:cytochrome d ubiquinol oxidase subunit II
VIADRARSAVQMGGGVLIVAFAAAGVWIAYGIDGYQIAAMPPLDAPPNPLAKQVVTGGGNWLANYARYPWMMTAPVLGFAAAALTIGLARRNRPGLAFISSSLAMSGVILTGGFSLFPFVMPSSTQLNSSLTLWDASSSHFTLTVMFWAAAIFVPIILLYTAWTYRAMWGRVTVQQIRDHTHSAY